MSVVVHLGAVLYQFHNKKDLYNETYHRHKLVHTHRSSTTIILFYSDKYCKMPMFSRAIYNLLSGHMPISEGSFGKQKLSK